MKRSSTPVDQFLASLPDPPRTDLVALDVRIDVNAVEDGAYLVKRYADRLGKVKVGSANVSFKRLSDIELDGLLDMVARARDLVASALPPLPPPEVAI